ADLERATDQEGGRVTHRIDPAGGGVGAVGVVAEREAGGGIAPAGLGEDAVAVPAHVQRAGDVKDTAAVGVGAAAGGVVAERQVRGGIAPAALGKGAGAGKADEFSGAGGVEHGAAGEDAQAVGA